jgi:hypothetical protein
MPRDTTKAHPLNRGQCLLAVRHVFARRERFNAVCTNFCVALGVGTRDRGRH